MVVRGMCSARILGLQHGFSFLDNDFLVYCSASVAASPGRPARNARSVIVGVSSAGTVMGGAVAMVRERRCSCNGAPAQTVGWTLAWWSSCRGRCPSRQSSPAVARQRSQDALTPPVSPPLSPTSVLQASPRSKSGEARIAAAKPGPHRHVLAFKAAATADRSVTGAPAGLRGVTHTAHPLHRPSTTHAIRALHQRQSARRAGRSYGAGGALPPRT